MDRHHARGLVLASIVLVASAAVAQPADDGREALLSTEDWTAADTDDDGTLSAAELDRAEPSLSAFLGEIDTDGDRRISRTELEAWRAEPGPGIVDADELPAGEVDEGDADEARERTDDLLLDDGDEATGLVPDDGDTATELLPEDADDDVDADDAGRDAAAQ